MRERISVSLAPRRCPALAAALLGLYLAAGAAVLVIDAPPGVSLGLAAVLAVAARGSLRRHALLSAPQACVGLRLREDGECSWQLRDGSEHAGRLAAGWFATPWLTVLRLTGQRSRRATAVLLTPCKVDADSHRRLRVLLATRF